MVEDDELPKSSGKRKYSDVWEHFEEVEVLSKKKKGEMERKVKCKSCSKLYMYPKTGTTTTMKRHLDGCFAHQGEKNMKKGQGTLNFDAADACDIDLPVVNFSGGYDNGKIRELIATMIIVHEYPFRMVEHFWFNVLMKTLNPSYQKTSRGTIRNDCLQIFKSRKETLKKELKSVCKISLTCDLWTSNQSLCYMSLVAHYIDSEWNMQYRVISFLELEPPHTGIVISQAIFECLSDWKIEDKIATITLDNATAKKVSKSDLVAYLDEAALTDHSEEFDVLLWWKQNSSRYPVLSKVAKDILTVPVSTVSSESSFSTGGRVLDKFRSSLLPNTVEALVCSASWIRGSQKKKKANKDKEDQDDLLEVPFLDKDPSIASTD